MIFLFLIFLAIPRPTWATEPNDRATLDELVRLSVDAKKPEGLCFAKTRSEKGATPITTLCYFKGEDVVASITISDDEQQNLVREMKAFLPTATLKNGLENKSPGGVQCEMPVEVGTVDSKGDTTKKHYCLTELTQKRRLEMRAWFDKNRRRLGL